MAKVARFRPSFNTKSTNVGANSQDHPSDPRPELIDDYKAPQKGYEAVKCVNKKSGTEAESGYEFIDTSNIQDADTDEFIWKEALPPKSTEDSSPPTQSTDSLTIRPQSVKKTRKKCGPMSKWQLATSVIIVVVFISVVSCAVTLSVLFNAKEQLGRLLSMDNESTRESKLPLTQDHGIVKPDTQNSTLVYAYGPPWSVPMVDVQCAAKLNLSDCFYTEKYGLFEQDCNSGKCCNAGRCRCVEYAMKRTIVRNRTIFRFLRMDKTSLIVLDESTPCGRNKICHKKVISEKKPFEDEISEWHCVHMAKEDDRTYLVEYPGEWEDNCGRISKCIETAYDDEEEQNATNKFLYDYGICNGTKLCTGYNKYVPKIQFYRCIKKFGRGGFCKNFPFSIRACNVCSNYVGQKQRDKQRNKVCGTIDSLNSTEILYRKDKSTGGCVIYCSFMPDETEVLPDGSLCTFDQDDGLPMSGMCIMGFCYPKNEAEEYKTKEECETLL